MCTAKRTFSSEYNFIYKRIEWEFRTFDYSKLNGIICKSNVLLNKASIIFNCLHSSELKNGNMIPLALTCEITQIIIQLSKLAYPIAKFN